MTSESLEELDLIKCAVANCADTWEGLAKAPDVQVSDTSVSFLNSLASDVKEGKISQKSAATALALCSICTLSIYEIRNEFEKIEKYSPNTLKLIDMLTISDADKNVLKSIVDDTLSRCMPNKFRCLPFDPTQDHVKDKSSSLFRFVSAYKSFRGNRLAD